MNFKKTKMMKAKEEEFGGKLEDILPGMIEAEGMSQTADRLGINKATFGYWMLKLNIKTARVVLLPGEKVVVQRKDGLGTPRVVEEF